jgi:hypothetical protein
MGRFGAGGMRSFRIALRAHASGEAASLSRRCSIFMWAGVSARMGSIGCVQAAGGPRAREMRAPFACVSQEAAACVRARGGSIALGRGWRAPSAHAGCRPGIPHPRASTETGYPRRLWKCAKEVDLISIRPLASAADVGSIRVCGAAFRTSTTGLRSPEPPQFCGIA